MTDIRTRIITISTAPSQKQDFDVWLQLKDAVAFLKDNITDNEFVMYVGTTHTFMHAILVPASLVAPPDIQDLMSWNCNASSSWGISYIFGDSPTTFLSPPLEYTGSKTLDNGEQLIFARRFEGRLGEKGYFEVLQKFVHTFDLHFLFERNAYCRFDRHGEIEDLIRIIVMPANADGSGGTIITFRREILDQYSILTDSVIVRTFDFPRYPSSFYGWGDETGLEFKTDGDLFYRSLIKHGYASYMRGCQIVRPQISKEAMIEHFGRKGKVERQYASFIAVDWKNRVIKEISSAPGKTVNYFTEADLPYEMSPAFFKPEVLSKYKADSDKYRLGDSWISCRGTWDLQTYGINEAGQVHTYLVYLRSLPYEEQLYWKSHNEKPKAGLSRRAFKTDFEGDWDLEYEPLESLKAAIAELSLSRVSWWTLRSEKLIDQVHYPITTSADEWSNEILRLDQLVVEGFEEKWLKHQAQSLGRSPESALRSLKLTEECLIGLGLTEENARRITAPFHQLHHLRSKVKGHAAGGDALEIRRQVLTEHQSYKEHFRDLCSKVDESLRSIAKEFKRMI